eukprot:s2197_g5.t1
MSVGRAMLMQLCLCLLALATDECEKEVVAAGSSLIQKQLSVHETVKRAAVHPWDENLFVVGSNHKTGSQLIRNTMAHFFDLLGASLSCNYWTHPHGTMEHSVTSLNHVNDCAVFPAPIRFHNHINKDDILQIRQEAHAMKADLRGVMIVRDPLEMVASAYVYHHRGAEPINPIEWGVPQMAPEEGVPTIAKRMLPVMHLMVGAYQVSAPEFLVVRYEDFTHSPEHFDSTVEKIMDFLFGDEITDLQRAEIKRAARVEDLNRASDLGLSAGNEVNHTNDEDEMTAARAAVSLISPEVYAKYVKFREELGYV